MTILFVECAFYLASTIVRIAQCKPIQTSWDDDIPGTCITSAALIIAISAFNVLLELAIILAPMPTIYRMNQPAGTRITIALVFTVGFL